MNSSPANTLRLFQGGARPVHPSAAWYLSDLGEFRGKQELYTRQSPQRLKVLREYALIESAVSSNRMEGVTVEPARIQHILAAPRPLFRDRDEEEVRGYRDALAWVHHGAADIPLDEAAIKRLHAMTRARLARGKA
jgi:Fic family protein